MVLVPVTTGAPAGTRSGTGLFDGAANAAVHGAGAYVQSDGKLEFVLAVGQFVPPHVVSSGNAFEAAAKYML